jgi:serine protease DegS
LVDAYGNLVGINTAVLDKTNTGTSVGIGFAIPADTAITALNDIVKHGRVVRGWLGIEARPLSSQQIESNGLSNSRGMMISAIYNNGPAHKAGLMPGDVITHINQQPVNDGRLSMLQVAQIAPGEAITIKLLRNGTELELTATMGTRPLASS